MTDQNTLPEGWTHTSDGTGPYVLRDPDGSWVCNCVYKEAVRIAHALSGPTIEDAKVAIAALPTPKNEDVMEGHEQAYRALEDLSPAPDLTKNTTPLDLLPQETRAALQALPDDALQQYSWVTGTWERAEYGVWHAQAIYRQNPDWTPEPLTKPDVPWDVLSDWVQWMARDADGDLVCFERKPDRYPSYWDEYSGRSEAISALKIDPGTCDWRDSLIQRPKEDK